jgi:hypothetical protein
MLRLGTMYMMKLAHGEAFSCPAGACWRNLFVVALMPWMKRHRVIAKAESVDHDEYELWVKEPSEKNVTHGLLDLVEQVAPPAVGAVLEQAENAMTTVQQGLKDAYNTAAGMVVDEGPADQEEQKAEKKTQ